MQMGDDDLKWVDSPIDSDAPSSPIERIFSFITRRRRSRRQSPSPHEVHGSSMQPVEVGADANHELYEMPVPPEPVELDSTNEGSFGDDTTELGTEGSENLTTYEIARRKLHRQLQGPVPTYSPPATGDEEKSEQDVSPVAHYRPGEDSSPVSSPSYENTTVSLPNTLPSPITPHGDWTNRFDLPSPMTIAPPTHFPFGGSSDSNTISGKSSSSSASISRASSSDGSNADADTPPVPPLPPAYKRLAIDPTRVVCLGPMPPNLQVPSSLDKVSS